MILHSKDAPPDGLIVVEYALQLVHILAIDEVKQTLTARVYVDQEWTDPSLSWNPADFDGLERTWLPLDAIWLPDVIVVNRISSTAPDDPLAQVFAVVYANGTVHCSLPAVFAVACEINVRHFPLDTQRCALEVASWAHDREKIRQWHLVNVSVAEQDYERDGRIVSGLSYEIFVRRKPFFFFFAIGLPSYVMCVITIIGLFARASTTSERIERFTLGVMATITTTSTAVLSMVVSEKVPRSSTTIPVLVAYFLFNMVVLSVAVVTTSFILRVHRCGRHGREPPHWAMRLFVLRSKKGTKPNARACSTASDATNSGRKSNDFIPRSLFDPSSSQLWTEDVVRAHRRLSAVTIDSPLRAKLYALETAMNQLCLVWRGTPNTRTANYAEARRAEDNGFVRIAERLDWCFMVLFLLLLTSPVVYFLLFVGL
ncbi:hypothetical protein M3Y99_00590000 [Aphelenchoides fujianensis]|nr:hypothetical protein M3Y99_00590000 [Aphelenchoides fujianensis]